jgi:hypothetical protein
MNSPEQNTCLSHLQSLPRSASALAFQCLCLQRSPSWQRHGMEFWFGNLMRGLPPMPRKRGRRRKLVWLPAVGQVRMGGRRQTYPRDGEEMDLAASSFYRCLGAMLQRRDRTLAGRRENSELNCSPLRRIAECLVKRTTASGDGPGRSLQTGETFRIGLRWSCGTPVENVGAQFLSGDSRNAFNLNDPIDGDAVPLANR